MSTVDINVTSQTNPLLKHFHLDSITHCHEPCRDLAAQSRIFPEAPDVAYYKCTHIQCPRGHGGQVCPESRARTNLFSGIDRLRERHSRTKRPIRFIGARPVGEPLVRASISIRPSRPVFMPD